jgi:hypothetical protein
LDARLLQAHFAVPNPEFEDDIKIVDESRVPVDKCSWPKATR